MNNNYPILYAAHEYEGKLIVCNKCHKPRNHSNHVIHLESIEDVCKDTQFKPDGPPEVSAAEVMAVVEDISTEILPEPLARMTALDQIIDQGHLSTEMTPEKIALQQDAAIIYRQLNIDEVFKDANGGPLTPLEIKQAQDAHESLLLLEWAQKDDWRDLYEKHIRNIQSIIQRYRALEITTRKVRTIKQTEEMMDITDEQREDFKRLAEHSTQKIKNVKTESIEVEAKKWLKQREAMIDAMSTMSGKDRSTLEQQFPIDPKYLPYSKKAVEIIPDVPKTPPELVAPQGNRIKHMSKREKAVESLVRAGVSRAAAETMVPES